MLSIIFYGRNDSYGYNLHKRGAISLNCIAELLGAPGDEILFVDYNTPDDFPTFPEAIADTLTDRAKKLLRILRVRPSHHERYRQRTPLAALEAVARNVAVRRSNPDNRWILSTNTDMVFVPRQNGSLAEMVAALPDAYYHLPRFEIPEPLWESLDRRDPGAIIATVGAWGRDFHLNEIVLHPNPAIKYDSPGDFQLILRADLWRVHGFNESMLLGWHVDSNIAIRLSLLPRQIGELVHQLSGYHCDHTRQLTPAHRYRSQQNDWQMFVDSVQSPYIAEQAGTWGLAGESVEELTVDATSRLYLGGLRSTIGLPYVEPTQLKAAGEADSRADYAVEHVIPFLAGIFASYPRDVVLGWLGTNKELLERFAELWNIMGFTRHIMVLKEARWLGPDLPRNCRWASDEVLDERSEVFTFDFGEPERGGSATLVSDEIINAVAAGFQRFVRVERLRVMQDHKLPRHFIGVNTIVNHRVRMMFDEDVAATLTPPGTRVKVGPVSEARKPQDGRLFGELDCMPALIVGDAGTYGPAPGRARHDAIHAKVGVAGILSYGPYFSLEPGSYEAIFEFYVERAERGAAFSVDVATQRGKRVLAKQRIKSHARGRNLENDLAQGQGSLTCVLGFNVVPRATRRDKELIEFRVWSPGTIRFCLVALRLRQRAAPAHDFEGTAARSP